MAIATPTLRTSQVRLPLACAAATGLTLLLVIPYRILQSGYLNHVSGAWAALADDAAHGVLYRPLSSALGYGGTRYFPLHIVLHALLVKLGLPLRPAGHLLSVLSAATLVAGGALGLRRRGAANALAWSGGVLALASRTAFMGAAGIRGDMLPLALGVLGLALVPRDRDDSELPAALVLALAMLSKPTLVWAIAGAFVALAAARRPRSALMLSALAGAMTAAGLLGALWWSHGEMLASFRAVAGGGGFSLAGLKMRLAYVRPGDLAWILGGVGLTVWRGRRAMNEPFCAAGLVCLPVTLLLYAGEGMHVNHLVDASSLGALAVASSLADDAARVSVTRTLLVVGTVLGLTEAILLDGMLMNRGDFERAAAAIPAGSRPILSEQPWVPLIAGERPFLIDAYSLEQVRRASPDVHADLLARIDGCAFRAVVLLGPTRDNPQWYDKIQFGEGFRQHLESAYFLSGIAGGHAVYLPRCGSAAGVPMAHAAEDTILLRGGRPSKLRVLLSRVAAR
jgi:hypothetical protein